MVYGGFGAFPFGKGFFPFGKGFDVPIGVLAGSYPRFVSPGYTTFPPFNGFGIGGFGGFF